MTARKLFAIRTLAALAAIGGAAAGHADSAHAKDAMDACIEAFVAEHVPKNRALKIRKVDGSTAFGAPHSEKIMLTAKGARSGDPIASATCVVTDGGASISLRETSAPARIAHAE